MKKKPKLGRPRGVRMVPLSISVPISLLNTLDYLAERDGSGSRSEKATQVLEDGVKADERRRKRRKI
jgi:metal-responsive CopG/Arc/MetJ family transcriptional regulator